MPGSRRSDSLNILFLTPQLPYPPHQGTALRNWGLISHLARMHRVSLLSFLAPGQSARVEPALARACRRVEVVPQPSRPPWRRLRDLLLTGKPDMALRLASPAFRHRLACWLKDETFDVVHVEGIEMACYLDLLRGGRGRPVVVFDDHNCEYLLQQRAFMTDLRTPSRWHAAAYSFAQWRRLRRYEREVCREADLVVAVSEADADALKALVPGLAPLVLPNGIDVAAYSTDIEPVPEMGSLGLVFTGKMDFRPNVDAVLWFAQELLPRIRRKMPQARFWVVGQRPHRRLERLRRDPAVTITGWVDDVRPFIAGAAVYVVPIRVGGGTRLKVLEALAMERAVVSTHRGVEGFPIRDGEHALLRDSPEAFAEAVVALLRDPARRRALGRAGRRFVEEHYDWGVLIPRLETAYSSRLSS